MEGKDDGDDIGTSGEGVPEASSGKDDREYPLGQPGEAVERVDPGDGEEPDPGDTDHEGKHVGAVGDRDGEREVIREATYEALEMLVSSGPIPSAGDLYQYSPDHQERILRMAEAPRTDESARRSEITTAQTSVIKRAQWIQAVIFTGCIAATAVSLWVFNQPLGVVFLGPPVIQGLNAIVQSVTGKS